MSSLKVSVLLKLKKDSAPVLRELDVSLQSDAVMLLKYLNEGGWVVTKRSTVITPQTQPEEIAANTVLRTIFGHVRAFGEYQCDLQTYRHELRRAGTVEWNRHEEWRSIAQGDIPVLFTTHLSLTEVDRWKMEYDEALREDESGATAEVEANGGDIICIAGWMKFTIPAPCEDGKELDMATTRWLWKKKRELGGAFKTHKS